MSTPVTQFNASWTDAGLRPAEIDLSGLFEHVMQRGVAIVRNVFPQPQLIELRDGAHKWGQRTRMVPPQTAQNGNFHTVQAGVSPRQKTLHVFHLYEFGELAQIPDELSGKLRAIFEPLRDFQNALTGNAAGFAAGSDGRRVHPQVIQYPAGGGRFDQHVHLLEPQRIGLILGLSERGRDFSRGSTHFEIEGKDVGTDEIHDIGDLILFRFDIPHWITPIDDEDVLDYSSNRGRWTAVLPYI